MLLPMIFDQVSSICMLIPTLICNVTVHQNWVKLVLLLFIMFINCMVLLSQDMRHFWCSGLCDRLP